MTIISRRRQLSETTSGPYSFFFGGRTRTRWELDRSTLSFNRLNRQEMNIETRFYLQSFSLVSWNRWVILTSLLRQGFLIPKFLLEFDSLGYYPLSLPFPWTRVFESWWDRPKFRVKVVGDRDTGTRSIKGILELKGTVSRQVSNYSLHFSWILLRRSSFYSIIVIITTRNLEDFHEHSPWHTTSDPFQSFTWCVLRTVILRIQWKRHRLYRTTGVYLVR